MSAFTKGAWPETTPPTPPKPLPGWAAVRPLRIVAYPGLVALACFVIVLLIWVISGLENQFLTALLMACTYCLMAIAAAYFIAMIPAGIKARKERRAGYTTMPPPYTGRSGMWLWNVDFRTGAILRIPGDPLMTRTQVKEFKLTGRRYTDEELMSGVRGKPGWYPDFRHGYVLTWWDGQQWTDHTA